MTDTLSHPAAPAAPDAPAPQPVTLTVNGERHSLLVPARTQLAELLRDRLDLTGTHLGCEQGVCGACTVMMDGRPVRSCITYAGACDGAVIETVEGFSGDALMDRLRTAFSKHHGLQCGFCTPGMLVTARDIAARLPEPDADAIRRELAGNLCRCTGYLGIVRAIAEVIEARNAAGQRPEAPAPAAAPAGQGGFTPFTPTAAAEETPARPTVTGRTTTDADGTLIERSFPLAHPPARVWEHMSDLAAVAACLPGARLDSQEGEAFSGAVDIRFGPIRAALKGQGTHRPDPAARTARITAEGADSAGKSAVSGTLDLAVQPAASETSTVTLALRFRITGPLAQFNRPELVAAFADQILAAFIANSDAVLSGRTPAPEAQSLGGFALLWSVVKARLSALIGRG